MAANVILFVANKSYYKDQFGGKAREQHIKKCRAYLRDLLWDEQDLLYTFNVSTLEELTNKQLKSVHASLFLLVCLKNENKSPGDGL
jgi:hypothetical protein